VVVVVVVVVAVAATSTSTSSSSSLDRQSKKKQQKLAAGWMFGWANIIGQMISTLILVMLLVVAMPDDTESCIDVEMKKRAI